MKIRRAVIKNTFNKRSYHGGFTLLEIMVSFSILTIGILSLLALMNSSIGLNRRSINEEIAQNIAQDAESFIRVIAQENILNAKNGSKWDDTIKDCVGSACIIGFTADNFTGGCSIKLGSINQQPTLQAGASGSDKVVKYDDDPADNRILGYYQLKTGNCDKDTKFTREINMLYDTGDPDHILNSSITVTWQEKGIRTFVLNSKYFATSSIQ